MTKKDRRDVGGKHEARYNFRLLSRKQAIQRVCGGWRFRQSLRLEPLGFSPFDVITPQPLEI
jgi:hypothetical protein